MKTILTKLKSRKAYSIFKISSLYILLFASAIVFTSCEEDYYGRDGRPGEAYLSLTWANEVPEYLDVGTGAIPSTFKWGDYYPVYPGFYVMYYEGAVWNGFGRTFYAYEVEYEIWVNDGQQGQPYGIDGLDGANTFLSIECSPYGPFIFSSEKSANITPKYKILKNIDDEIQVLQETDTFSMKITYKRKVHSKVK